MPKKVKKKEAGKPIQPKAPDDCTLSYVDFEPTQKEKFRDLISKANSFLAHNHHMRPVMCESYETKAYRKGGCSTKMLVDSSQSSYVEYAGDKAVNYCCRCLRLWVEPRGSGDDMKQIVLDYTTVSPECIEKGGLMKHPKYEDFPTMFNKLNQQLKLNPIPGKILNLDTQEVRFSEWREKFDFDETHWAQPGIGRKVWFLNLLRIVYIEGPPAYEQIGYHDSIPICYDEGKNVDVPDFEPFLNVNNKAQAWLNQQGDKRIINMQTLPFNLPWKAKKGTGTIDPTSSLTYEGGRKGLFAVRILRVYYSTSDSLEPTAPPKLTYRTFHPALTRNGARFVPPEFESHIENMKRVWAYLKHTKARVIGVETIPCTVMPDTKPECSIPENCLEQNAIFKAYGNCQVFVIRLYLDGEYQEPPVEAMPGYPAVLQAKSACCFCSLI